MNKLFFLICLLLSLRSFGQKDTTKWLRAFPITDYMVDASDSVKIVQIRLPYGVKFSEKQFGLLKGMYRDKHADTIAIGAGRCNLIKGDYYYFTINHKASGRQPREGDLLYTFMEKTAVYRASIVRLASYYIGLQNVYEKPLYNRYEVFSDWQRKDEEALIDSMVADIHFTGDYFLSNNPSMNVKIKSGKYEGKMVLNTMITCGKQDVKDFLEYITARPNLYAGHEWKISEIFATWLSEGTPTVVKN
ncbi:MAG: hypothetical protein ACHQFX_14570 [Chitinophagales bacterium]